jgi:hypothetical protein
MRGLRGEVPMQTNLEQCPLCGSELSQIKFREIRAKLREQEERKATELAEAKLGITRELEQEFKRKLEQERKDSEKRARAEAQKQVDKVTTERDALTGKLKAAEVREAEIRKQAQAEVEKQRLAAEKKARTEVAIQVQKLTSERDLASKKLKEAEARGAEIRKQVQEEATKEWQKQLTDQRATLEKDRDDALLKKQAEQNRERESWQKKIKVLEHQLQKKTANELGDGGEIKLFEALRDAFQGDRITRIQKGQPGADILHEIQHKGEVCGRIITDSKNRQGWRHTYVTKLRQDKVEAKAEHAILATTVFPPGMKELCIESDVIVVSPARVVYITELLRQAMIAMHIKGLSLKERSNKMSQLYSLITSESYSKKFGEAGRLAEDILDLDVQEVKDHNNVWKKRGTLATRLKKVLRDIETDVASIIEGEAAEEQRHPIEVRRVAS